jgi:hypothetical protein
MRFWLIVALLVMTSVLGSLMLYAFSQKRELGTEQPTRPRRVTEDTTTKASRAGTIRVAAGGDFQRALNSAHCGDTIILEAGAHYSPVGDSFILPKKDRCTGTDADYITIQTSNLGGIAAAGDRIDPAKHAAAMPRLVGNRHSVLTAAPGAHHFKFIGIEITTTGNRAIYTPDLINFGSYFTPQQKLDTNHIFFDRVFIHTAEITSTNLFPSTVERTSGRGIGAGISDLWVINSYIAGFCGKYPSATENAGQMIDSYGIYSDTGPGPLHIINNYIEAQFNNVFLGGTGQSTSNTATISNATLSSATLSSVANLHIGDLVAFAYSTCTTNPNPRAKPWQTGKISSINGNNVTFQVIRAQNSCEAGVPTNGGLARWRGDFIHDVEILRNTLNKPDVWNAFSNPKAWIEIKGLVNGIVDGNDMYSGVGTAIALTVRNEDGASPWCTIENVGITNNRIRGYKWAFSLLMSDNEQPSMMGGNLTIKNNLFYKPLPVTGSAGNFLQLVGGHDITIQHNTLLQPGNPVVDDLPTPNFVFKDNIVSNYQYGMNCTIPPNRLSACWPSLVMIIDTRWDKSGGLLSSFYPVGNYYANTAADVGFVDLANDNYALAPASRYKGKASDRTDPGCNIAVLGAAMGGQ